jgi:hypothetical protein
MTDNSRKIMENMQASFPHLYNVYDKKTILYALLSVFGERLGMRTDIIDRLYAMIGIDSTYDEDLEHRWGSLLGMYRQNNESYNNYRSRLIIAYLSLSGGTAEAIKYAIASVVGITTDEDIDKYIHVYDAWEYPYDIDPELLGIDEYVDETSLYGSSICTIDMSNVTNADYTEIMDTINQVKASGINAYLMFLYGIISESAVLSRDDVIHDIINMQTNDMAELYEIISTTAVLGKAIIGRAIFGNSSGPIDNPKTDNFIDNIVNISNESTSLSNFSSLWSNIGTNSAVLNESLVTNMYLEADSCIDIINYVKEV